MNIKVFGNNLIKYSILIFILISNLYAEQSISSDYALRKATLAPRTSFLSNNLLQESEELRKILSTRPQLAKELAPLLNELSNAKGNQDKINKVLEEYKLTLTEKTKNYKIFFEKYLPNILKKINSVTDTSNVVPNATQIIENLMDEIKIELEKKISLLESYGYNVAHLNIKSIAEDNALLQFSVGTNLMGKLSNFPTYLQDIFKLLILLRSSQSRDNDGNSKKSIYINNQGKIFQEALELAKKQIENKEKKLSDFAKRLMNAEKVIRDQYFRDMQQGIISKIDKIEMNTKIQRALKSTEDEMIKEAKREAENNWNKMNPQSQILNSTEKKIDEIFSEFYNYIVTPSDSRLKEILNKLNDLKKSKIILKTDIGLYQNPILDSVMVAQIISFAMFDHDKNGEIVKVNETPVLRGSFKVIGEKMSKDKYNLLREMFKFNFLINQTITGADIINNWLNSVFNSAA